MRRVIFATTLLGATAVLGPAVANDALMKLMQDPNQWVIQTGDYANTRFSKLDQINAGQRRQAAGGLDLLDRRAARPRGRARSSSATSCTCTRRSRTSCTRSTSTNDGKILWKYEPKQDPNVIPVMCCDTVNRGLAYADGKVFLHQADTTLVALDAKTGKVVWSVVNGDPKKGETNTATVLPVKDKVIVGISGGEFGVRCHVTAYDLKTGKQVWRAYSMGPDNEMLIDPEKTTELGKPVGKDFVLKTWQGDQWKIGGGMHLGLVSPTIPS